MTTPSRLLPTGYAAWLNSLKNRIRATRQKAALSVNQELTALYWQIGKEILERQARRGWGAKIVERLAKDLGADFPEMKGFSPRNLKYMRAFAEAWPDLAIVQQTVAQLPWGHNLVLLTKLKNKPARLAYAKNAIEHGWSRNVLNIQIELQSVEREGRAITNFEQQLPAPHSDLAREALKDPYKFDFLSLGQEAGERAIENALVQHITRFLVEMGTGFAYVGRQVPLEVGGEDFFIDLLFYHVRLHCYVVIELKAGAFKPEHLGQLNFYLSAIDAQMKQPEDNPSIGILLCKNRNRVVAEYALRDVNKPIGVAEYQLVKALPKKLRTALPTIKEIEAELTAKKSGAAAAMPLADPGNARPALSRP
jgi:predicted nuclease of restriction endonuclease-like (RecB) superfamily